MVKVQIDSHHVIGQTHISTCNPCQDYTHHETVDMGAGKQFVVAALSDGCSGSFGVPELGATLMCVMACREVKNAFILGKELSYIFSQEFWRNFIQDLKMSRLVASDDLDATLLVVATDGEELYYIQIGDGAVYGEYAKEYMLYNIEFKGNAPSYPSYLADVYRGELYQDSKPHLLKTINRVDLERGPVYTQTEKEEVDLGKNIFSNSYRLDLSNNRILSFSLFSDGITQMRKIDSTSGLETDVTTLDAVRLMQPNSGQGRFVGRRVLKVQRGGLYKFMDDYSQITLRFTYED